MEAIGISRNAIPVRLAMSAASSRECCEEWTLGIPTPYTDAAPRASTAMAAVSAESMPPDMPMTTLPNPFFLT